MIQVIFKSKGEKIRAQLPERWEEITVKQFMALETLSKPLEIMAEVMGIDLTFIENTLTDLTPAMNRIIQIFNARPPGLEDRKPQGFGFQGKNVKLPRDLDLLMFGQLIQINELLGEDVNKHLVKIMGIALQPVIDGEYIEANQEKYSSLIETLPIIEVFPELFFFAEKLRKYKRYGMSASQLSLSNQIP